MKVMVTPVSEQTLTNLSVQVRKGAWSGLPAGNDGFRAGVSLWRTQKGHARLKASLKASLEARSTHPCVLSITYERLRGEMIRILTLLFSIALFMNYAGAQTVDAGKRPYQTALRRLPR